MLLDNYKRLFLPVNNENLKNLKNEITTMAPYTSSQRPMAILCSTPISWGNTISGGASWIDVGTGDTPESTGDYVMTDMNMFTGALSVLSLQSLTRSIGEIINLNIVVKNNGGSNVTIREIGILCNPSQSNASFPSSISNANYECLIFRKVLETPVTIAPGDSYNINYVVRFKN